MVTRLDKNRLLAELGEGWKYVDLRKENGESDGRDGFWQDKKAQSGHGGWDAKPSDYYTDAVASDRLEEALLEKGTAIEMTSHEKPLKEWRVVLRNGVAENFRLHTVGAYAPTRKAALAEAAFKAFEGVG